MLSLTCSGSTEKAKLPLVTRDVEEILGRKPTSFAKFLQDYRDAFQARGQAAI